MIDFEKLGARFWKRVRRPAEGCWAWTGALDRRGYGVVKVEGSARQAHRVAYELAVGPITRGLHVLHRCDNPQCVRPDHLHLGTHQDNMQEREERKRGKPASLPGASNPQARLTKQQAQEIRSKATRPGVTPSALAREYGVSVQTVTRVLRWETYR